MVVDSADLGYQWIAASSVMFAMNRGVLCGS